MSKNVKYVGSLEAHLPSLGIAVQPGDVISVPDDFENSAFEPVKSAKIPKSDVAEKTPDAE